MSNDIYRLRQRDTVFKLNIYIYFIKFSASHVYNETLRITKKL